MDKDIIKDVIVEFLEKYNNDELKINFVGINYTLDGISGNFKIDYEN